MADGWGTTIHDVSGNGNHGTAVNITESLFWGDTGPEGWAPNLTRGFAEWTDGTNTTRVPYLADLSGPASTNVAGSTLVGLRPANVVHNNSEVTIDGYSYANLLTNETWTVTTNDAGFITEMRR